MKLAALLLFFAIIGKMSAAPVPYRLAYYRAAPAPQQQQLVEAEEEDADDDETEISQEDFSQDGIQDEIQDDDDESDEQELPPQFQKLFPLPQRNGPGHNFPLSVMMGEISAQGWNVPKNPVKTKQSQRARQELELAQADDDDDDSDEDEEEDEEEDDEPEDDLPDWQKLFPNLQDQGSGPPEGVVDTSTQPEIPAAYRSAIGGSRVVYIPARQLRRSPVQQVIRRPVPQRSQVMYGMMPSSSPYIRRQPVIQNRPQYVYASSSMQNRHRPQYVMQRRPQQSVYYMPVRRNSYSPYVSPYVPRYRYY